MSNRGPGERDGDPLAKLDTALAAFEAGRVKTPAGAGVGGEAGAGYRLLGQMLGGVLGGIGLGWLVDHFAHTTPWGLVSGLLIGAGLSIYSTVRTASRLGARTAAQVTAGSRAKSGSPGPREDDDDGLGI
jgi:ATP synthase protein I